MMKKVLRVATLLAVCVTTASANQIDRPFMWATAEERPALLEKIENVAWAANYYEGMKSRVDARMQSYTADKESYLKELPLDWERQQKGQFPPFVAMTPKHPQQNEIPQNVSFATDCSVLYYITGEKQYAQCALDILYTFAKGLEQTEWRENNKTDGGWIYPDEHLREARYMASIPVVYDFIYPYIKSGKAKAYNVATGKSEKFDTQLFQDMFETYAILAIESGHSGSNWSVLESTSLVNSALALDDEAKRSKYVKDYLEVQYERQDPLSTVAKKYEVRGDIWDETSQYSGHVAGLSVQIMYQLNRYDSSLQLCKKYPNIAWSLPRWAELTFPNGDVARFGDGKRYLGVHMEDLDMAYALAEQDGVEDVKDRMAQYILAAMQSGEYNRPEPLKKYSNGVSVYIEPAYMLWLSDEIEAQDAEVKPLPRTDKLSHAALYLQRNISPNNNPADGLMSFVAGASHVHSHAGGMNMELYGKGEVLGVDAGNGPYRTDFHENYSRLFAAHNCVITNGRSGSNGDWVNLGTESVQLVSMEPMPNQAAISSNYSYSTTSFEDNKAPGTNGTQQRTMAVVRTSPTTGYYVDVFRAKSTEPNQFHDYLYHNIAKELEFINEDMEFVATPERYSDDLGQKWVKNQSYIHPGWRFFKNAESVEGYSSDVEGVFKTPFEGGRELRMKFYTTGSSDRAYTKTDAAPTYQAPEGYDDVNTPTMVVRQSGEAWDRPFAFIYEPTDQRDLDGSITSVEELTSDSLFKGFCVKSEVDGASLTQYIISQQGSEESVTLPELGITLKGRFAIITLRDGELSEIYAGDSYSVTFGDTTATAANGSAGDIYVDYTAAK